MKICRKCKSDFEPSKGLVSYCSITCRNSREFSSESIKKKSEAQKKFLASLSTEERNSYNVRLKSHLKTEESFNVWRTKLRVTYHKKLLSKDFSELGFDGKRKIIRLEQNYCCDECGINEWLGKPIVLEIDHIDGNNKNNERSNLRGLCPNCHSVTPTWRGRNKPAKNGDNKITDEVLLQHLKDTDNIRQALLLSGLAAKGANYARAKRLAETLT